MKNEEPKRSPAVVAWTRVVRLYQRLDKLSERNFADLGLNTACFDVLARVSAREGLTQGELAESLLVTKGNVSQLVTKLVREGLVERRAEGRRQRLFLSPKGHALALTAIPRQEALLRQSLAPLSAEEQNELLRLLRKWGRP
jgi:DNA-binding MarR family transcriptional regulator